MRLSKELPTKEGWYWYQDYGYEPCVLQVIRCKAVLGDRCEFEGGLVVPMGGCQHCDMGPEPIENLYGRWSIKPIPLPENATPVQPRKPIKQQVTVDEETPESSSFICDEKPPF